ncbi:hypothetical protein LguiA_035030 [Lonicera macranthoides]
MPVPGSQLPSHGFSFFPGYFPARTPLLIVGFILHLIHPQSFEVSKSYIACSCSILIGKLSLSF